jgi:hypothetical protein
VAVPRAAAVLRLPKHPVELPSRSSRLGVGVVRSRVFEEPVVNCVAWLAIRSSRSEAGERRMVDQTGARWNRLASWLRQVDLVRSAA